MFRKIMQYAHLHEYNPDKYPATRVPIEMRAFLDDIKELMLGFFGGNDSILGRVFIFFVDNPILVFISAFGLAFGSFSLIVYTLKTARM